MKMKGDKTELRLHVKCKYNDDRTKVRVIVSAKDEVIISREFDVNYLVASAIQHCVDESFREELLNYDKHIN